MKYPWLSLLILLVACNSSGDKASSDDSTGKNTTSQEIIDIKPKELKTGELPATIKFKGDVNEAWQWKDKLGDNILITTIAGPFPEEERTVELHAFHFVKKENDYKLLWKISDASKNCPFDITAEFIDSATTITDLDKNGIAETTVQYALVCRSDVSPAAMKIIMHEDTVKYSLRGWRWLYGAVAPAKFAVTEKDVNLEKLPKPKDEWEEYIRINGRYQSEKEFSKAPPEFLTYARSQWLKYAVESFD